MKMKANLPIYFNRKYSIHYVWNPETLDDGMVRTFFGSEIYYALKSIRKLSDKQVADYTQSLHQLIVTTGRYVTRQEFSDYDKKSSIKLVQLANNGCKKSNKKLYKSMKLYIAFHLHELMERDAKIATDISELKNTEFTVNDVVQNCPARLTIYDPLLEAIFDEQRNEKMQRSLNQFIRQNPRTLEEYEEYDSFPWIRSV
ncbi:MAG: hypothetical protein WBK55_07700 [Alphaproteobacteria bacterium]